MAEADGAGGGCGSSCQFGHEGILKMMVVGGGTVLVLDPKRQPGEWVQPLWLGWWRDQAIVGLQACGSVLESGEKRSQWQSLEP